MTVVLGLDIGSNSVGSAWINTANGELTTGVSVFPAGVDESDDKRGDPKNAKRRMARRTRITLARRAQRKRELRQELIRRGLLPGQESDFQALLENTDPWELRRKGLDSALKPWELGRVLLHLAQRRGALGLHITDPTEAQADASQADKDDDGKVKAAIGAVRAKMLEKQARTFGEFIAMVRAERVTKITSTDMRRSGRRNGPRVWREPIRNKAASYEHCADRAMIRDEFAKLWDAQAQFPGDTAKLLTPELRRILDDDSGDAVWRHKGLLFGQRRQSWDLGTLGRCTLHPDERCVPHADRFASQYLVVETVNNLKILEDGKPARPLTPEERHKLKSYLSGPLGMEIPRKQKGQTQPPPPRPKRNVSVTDLRCVMGSAKDGWGKPSKTSRFRFNIENDEDRAINTDWFSREIIHGVVTPERWEAMPEDIREGLNRAILKYDPEYEEDAHKLRLGAMNWAGLDHRQADALVEAWKTRPKPDAKRLSMSRRATRNLLQVMDRPEPWPDSNGSGQGRWLTQIEARRLVAEDGDFRDKTTGELIDDITRQRYATGAKGATARDRHYMRKHLLRRHGEPVYEANGLPLPEPPPAPLISNPVVRKAIHEVRRHLIEYMATFGRMPDTVCIELAREARMGKKDADRALFTNRLRNRIRNDIISEYDLRSQTTNQQRAAVDRVILCTQQGEVCPLCGQGGITPRMAALGENCEIAHIIPRASGGHNGLSNIVLAHTKCNRDMGRRTPRDYWSIGPGFDQGMTWVQGIYGNIDRIKWGATKTATGLELWKCYFTKRDDITKLERFKVAVSDVEVQGMTQRQDAATKYAARQVMAYLADALYGGKGLPERATGAESEKARRIFTTDGLWTSRLRREWGLFFDPHQARAHGLSDHDEHERKEKNRGDHHHHAIDAVVTAICTRQVQMAWEQREKQADADYWSHVQQGGSAVAYETWMDNYRSTHPLSPPAPFNTRESFREAVRRAVFGDEDLPKPICHRPVKRKLIGALHEETLFGPALDQAGRPTGNYTAKKSVLALDPNHLRMPRKESEKEAIARLAERRKRLTGDSDKAVRAWARKVVSSSGYHPAMIDPPPGKSGIVRDLGLRRAIRNCMAGEGLDPDDFSATDIKKLCPLDDPGNWRLRMPSGVPIKSVVLLRTMNDPVLVQRKRPDYVTGQMVYDDNLAAQRAYVGGNNHHIEIRQDAKGKWSGQIVTAFEAAQRNLSRLNARRQAGIPKGDAFRKLSRDERNRLQPVLAAIEKQHVVVDRTDDEAKGGAFVMSLCEGETLLMRRKGDGGSPGEVGFFVVAKLDKPQRIVVVPHWDARAATERKDAAGNKVPNSQREDFAVTPTDLQRLAPPGHEHAVKVRVSPLGKIQVLLKD